MKSDVIRLRDSIKNIHARYEYDQNIPPRGLSIGGRPALTQIDPKRVGEYVIVMVRDPLVSNEQYQPRQLVDRLERKEIIGDSGMFKSYSGYYKGAHITVVSGGSGSSETELILYDFMEFTDANTFLRVGGSGGIGVGVEPGDVVISTGIVRDEGMTQSYIPAGYPAFCNYEVINAMVQAAETVVRKPYHLGVTLSCDSDYVGCGRPGVGGYLQPWNIEKVGIYNRAGVLNGDRESAAIVTLSNLFGRRGGSICSVADNISTGAQFKVGIGYANAIDIALEGCAILHLLDQQKEPDGNWYPALYK